MSQRARSVPTEKSNKPGSLCGPPLALARPLAFGAGIGAPITTDSMKKDVLYYGSAAAVQGKPAPFVIIVHMTGESRVWLISPTVKGDLLFDSDATGITIKDALTKQAWEENKSKVPYAKPIVKEMADALRV